LPTRSSRGEGEGRDEHFLVACESGMVMKNLRRSQAGSTAIQQVGKPALLTFAASPRWVHRAFAVWSVPLCFACALLVNFAQHGKIGHGQPARMLSPFVG